MYPTSETSNTQTWEGSMHTAGVDGHGQQIWHHGTRATCAICSPVLIGLIRCNHVCPDHPPRTLEGDSPDG